MGGSTYAVAGVVLFVVGCVLSLLATARRTAQPRRSDERPDDGPSLSASVARLRRDVSGWSKRGETPQAGRRTIA